MTPEGAWLTACTRTPKVWPGMATRERLGVAHLERVAAAAALGFVERRHGGMTVMPSDCGESVVELRALDFEFVADVVLASPR